MVVEVSFAPILMSSLMRKDSGAWSVRLEIFLPAMFSGALTTMSPPSCSPPLPTIMCLEKFPANVCRSLDLSVKTPSIRSSGVDAGEVA